MNRRLTSAISARCGLGLFSEFLTAPGVLFYRHFLTYKLFSLIIKFMLDSYLLWVFGKEARVIISRAPFPFFRTMIVVLVIGVLGAVWLLPK